MARRTVALAVAALLAAANLSAATAKSMYADALAREQAVRPALIAAAFVANGDADTATLTTVHAVVAAYEAVVRRYPASGYSHNALWQAGRLSLDAFARFGQAKDKIVGVRLLRTLADQYPTSKLAKQVPGILTAEADTASSTGARGPTPTRSDTSRSSVDSRARLATIKDVRRELLPDAVRVTIELDAEVAFHDERLADPARVFVDLPSARAAAPLVDQTLRFDGDTDVVRQIRIGRHPNNTTRVVLDAAGVSSYSIYALYNPYRLVIDCARPILTAPPTPPVSSAVPPATIRPEPAPSPPVPAASTPGPTASPAKNVAGGFSIARQLGLSVSRIVIDPGHGGHDTGAKGRGVTEADLVLDVALRLEALLQKVPGIEVILTRRTDEFIPLPERTAFANREGADLFLSIHANASPNAQARGIETYFLNFANNQSAAAVAARENAESTQSMGALPDFVKAIALNNKLDESRDFATQVQHAMIDKLRGANKTVKDLGVRQAPFVVLIGAVMPAVLAEISFITNPAESKLLRSPAYRQRIAEALLVAVRKYQTSLKGVTAIAHQ
jgi:N-acetylmuramoyl-L-alanine amidase